jgi:nucleoside-diphosphate kinase
MNIAGYADEFTRRKLGAKQEKTLALIKPDAVQHVGPIVDEILSNDLTLCAIKMVKLSVAEAQGLHRCLLLIGLYLARRWLAEFYGEHRGKPFFDRLVSFMTSGPIVALELLAADAIRVVCDFACACFL